MQYVIEVDGNLNDILVRNAANKHMSVEALVTELLKRYTVDAHIMEQSELWKSGIDDTAEINLDWANL